MPKILIIDDNPSVRVILQDLFTAGGFSVVAAVTGAEGLAMAVSEAVDVAIVDVHLQGMDGIEVCRRLRAPDSAGGAPIPVWLITGAPTSLIEQLGAAAGAEGTLGKPFDAAKLMDEMKLVLARGKRPPPCVPPAPPTAPADEVAD